jgi:ABC-2 type transport system permease protein
VTYAAPGAPPVGLAEPPAARVNPVAELARLFNRIATLCWVEMRKIRHDRSELYTRAVQPALWLLIYGEVFTRVHAIPTPAGIPYLAYLAPGIMAQSALFIAIFYGIQIIWERDAGVLTKLMVTPTPRAALITGKAFASSVRSLVQGVVVLVIATLLGVSFTDNPLKLIAALIILALGSAFFSCLSMTLAGVVVARDRLMGIGQAITMPLFFSSSALYPQKIMPGWLQVISKINPLTYEVEALRGLLIGTATTLWLDLVVLVGATILSITCAALLLPRLANRYYDSSTCLGSRTLRTGTGFEGERRRSRDPGVQADLAHPRLPGTEPILAPHKVLTMWALAHAVAAHQLELGLGRCRNVDSSLRPSRSGGFPART